MKNRKALLIDGNSLAYRAFYALPDTMKNSEGHVTNAVYGFASMIMKLLDEECAYIAIAFDRKEPTFRHTEFEGYKATRDKAPPTLHEQMPLIKELAQALNIPVFESAGFEADDIIGTMAKKAEKEGYNVEIFSGDLDPLQLINKHINVMTLRKGITDIVRYDEKAVEERYGLRPDQLIDYKALKGDTSDNIPGIPGIGEKTAVTLLQRYGTLDNIFELADEIEKPKLKQLIKTGHEKAMLSKRLGTIVTDVPIRAELSEKKEPDWEKVLALFEKLDFDNFAKKLKEKRGVTVKETVDLKRKEISKYDFELVDSKEKLVRLREELEKKDAFAFDTETDSLNAFKANLVGIALSAKEGKGHYIPVGHLKGTNLPLKQVIAALKPLLEGKKVKIGHNLKYDIEVLSKYGIEVSEPYFDTMVAAYLLDPISGGLSLKKVGAHYLGRHEMIKLNELIGKDAGAGNFSEVPVEIAKDYASSDANVTFELYKVFKELLEREKMLDLAENTEMPLIGTIVKMEEAGVFIDADELHGMKKEIEKTVKGLEKDIFAISGEVFNLNSPKQLAAVLFDKLKLPVLKKTKTGPSTDAGVLEELAQQFEIAEKIMEYRSLTKLVSTYIETLPELIDRETGRIHASFNQTVTATGRLSSSDPNLQNIPIRTRLGKRIREAFVPQKKGHSILAADYSQVELRILAHLSRDERLIKAFNDDEDIHTATAAEIFDLPHDRVTKEMRSQAKTVNFGIIYGISDFGLAKSLKIRKTEAASFIKRYFEKYPGVDRFIKETIEQARKDGFVCTMLGRKRPLPDINSPNWGLKSFAERTAINTPVQGTAADMIKIAMVNISSKIKGKMPKMIMQVHDELVFEVPDDEVEEMKKLVGHEMSAALPLSVPVKVDIGVGKSWAEAK